MTDSLLVETAHRALGTAATFDAVQAAESERWSPTIWKAAASLGLPWISVPESAGGVGGTVSDAVAVLVAAGRHAAPIPLAETGLLAGWLLSAAGLTVGDGPLTVVPGRAEDDLRIEAGRLSGTAHRVPWAAAADRIVALVHGQVVVVSPSSGVVTEVSNLAGEPRETVTFDAAEVESLTAAPDGIDAEALAYRGALSRAALMAGALGAVEELTVRYTSERRQFGRPVGSFQAVQALVVLAAEEAALVDMAVQVAGREADRGGARFEIASAKLLADEAAQRVSRAAHQAHGAMGMTQEYPLHHLTRRLWAWRSEYGDLSWSRRLGGAVQSMDPGQLYRAIAEGSNSGISL
jgi:acyl-CoA dehydrogenase